MPRVLPPKRGKRLRYDRGRADGVFIVDGKRTFRFLELVSTAGRTAGGGRRTGQQTTDYLHRRWDAKKAELEAELAERSGDGLTVAETFDKWKEWARAQGLAESTIDLHYEIALANYKTANGDHRLNDIRLQHLDRFKAHLVARNLAPATINLRLSKVAAFLRWAQRRDYLEALPRIEPVKQPRRLARVMAPTDIRRLIERLRGLARDTVHSRQQRFYQLHELLLVLVLCTGMRRGEPFQSRWADVDLEEGTMRIPRPKEHDEKLVALPPLAVAYLKNWRRQRNEDVYLFDDGSGQLAYKDAHALTRAFRRHMIALGLGDKRIKPLHSYRATLSTIGLDLLGLDPVAVQAQLGHASLKTTQDGYVATMLHAKRRVVGAYEEGYLKGLFDRELSEPKGAKRTKPRASRRRKR